MSVFTFKFVPAWLNSNFLKMSKFKNYLDLKVIKSLKKIALKNCSDFKKCSNWEVMQIYILLTFIKWSDLKVI